MATGCNDENTYNACQPSYTACVSSSKSQTGADSAACGGELVSCTGLGSKSNTYHMECTDGFLNVLEGIRQPLADYQERNSNLSSLEQYGFFPLMTGLCQQTYFAFLAILLMVYHLLPVVEAYLFMVRFILDKLIEILRCQSVAGKALKSVLFLGEMIIIAITVMVMFCFILIPVYNLFKLISFKTWNLVVKRSKT